MSAFYCNGILTPGGVGANNSAAAQILAALGYGGDPVAEISVGGIAGQTFGACTLTVTVSTNGGASYAPALLLDVLANPNAYLSSPVNLAANDNRMFYLATQGITNVSIVSSVSAGGVPVFFQTIRDVSPLTQSYQSSVVSMLGTIIKGMNASIGDDITQW